MAGDAGQGSGQGSGRGSSQASKPGPGNRRVAQWTRGYARLPGIPDEYLAQDGTPRAVWTRFFDAFAELTPGDIERRFGSADRHLREAGVTYRTPGETAERHWPLSHLPLLIDEADWQQLTAGIVQRAELLELVLGDLYGEGRLIAENAVPAAAIAGSAEYLRAVCGIKPPGGRYLNMYAADVGRGPDGRWWVLGDRTQSPSGAGYALENRLVLSRAFTTLYKSMNVERVAPFFEAFRDALRASADRDEPRIGLLTPGIFRSSPKKRRLRLGRKPNSARASSTPEPGILATTTPFLRTTSIRPGTPRCDEASSSSGSRKLESTRRSNTSSRFRPATVRI